MAFERNLRTGKLARGAITGLAVAQAGVSHLGHRARQLTTDSDKKAAAQEQHEADIGRILFRALNQLKGTALKVSQLLSMEVGVLPDGVRKELAKGFYQVTPLNRALVHKVFRQEFGQTPEQLFSHFEPHSFAAASLGQVHHASLIDDQGATMAVAVKVQYPGIAGSIASDMRLLRGILQTLSLTSDLMPRKSIIERVMNDIEHKLAEEVDYLHEAAQLHWFHGNATLPGVVIPLPVESHSTRRVLTMQQLDGLHLDQWLATEPDQAARNHYGQLLFDWFLHSAFELGRLHADPHPGNFLFLPDGRLGLLDFGCTKQLSPSFVTRWTAAVQAILHRPAGGACDAVHQAYIDLQLIAADMSLEDFTEELMPAVIPLQEWQMEPFRSEYFDFANKSPYPMLNPADNKMLARHLANILEELPYFDRAYMGLMHMLKKMDAVVCTKNRWIF
ncbi:MAG: AarF/ABC1/UbiB kinase family protein [Pseudomonadota bacterium]